VSINEYEYEYTNGEKEKKRKDVLFVHSFRNSLIATMGRATKRAL